MAYKIDQTNNLWKGSPQPAWVENIKRPEIGLSMLCVERKHAANKIEINWKELNPIPNKFGRQ